MLPEDKYWVKMWLEPNDTTQKPKFRVYRNRNSGHAWEPFSRGYTRANHLSALYPGGLGNGQPEPPRYLYRDEVRTDIL